jgi:undecaprenyl-diphosphatase
MDWFSIVVLGLVQGVTEWVPISSKTQDTFVYLRFLGGSPELVVPILLYLHLGTLLAAAIYFRKELGRIIQEIAGKPMKTKTYTEGRNGYLLSALFFTGLVGLPILYAEKKLLPAINGAGLYFLMGAGLIATGAMLLTQRRMKSRHAGEVGLADGAVTGIMQGLSTIPGISRSGTTSTALIWRGFDSEGAFNLSFLLSIPTVALTEVLFYVAEGGMKLPLADGVALAAASFVFGYVTLDAVLRAVKKANLGVLSIALGAVIIFSALTNAG